MSDAVAVARPLGEPPQQRRAAHLKSSNPKKKWRERTIFLDGVNYLGMHRFS